MLDFSWLSLSCWTPLVTHEKINRKSDISRLLPKSNLGLSSAKPDIWDPSSIKSGYFGPSAVLEGGFRMTLPQQSI
jgi:hypothetical protein